MEEKKFALLIDADNISAKYVSGILDEIAKYGIATYKRIYGDWTSSQSNKWKQELLANSIIPIQQFSNTTGKNATDSALIIDAMDILYRGKVDGFCIVSSDSDFTRLASRLRESGMTVMGMGEDKTPQSFRNACTRFTSLENLLDSEEGESGEATLQAVEATIAAIITENANNGRTTGLGEIGSRLQNKYPDFDLRNFGYTSLSKFIEELPRFSMKKRESTVTVELSDNREKRSEITEYIRTVVKRNKAVGIGLSELSNLIHKKFPNYSLKDYGYSQFSKFVQSIEGMSISEDATNQKRVWLKD